MDENTTTLTAQECYEAAADALRNDNVDLGNHWRMLGDSVATTSRLGS